METTRMAESPRVNYVKFVIVVIVNKPYGKNVAKDTNGKLSNMSFFQIR
ncbi:hypothetical protein X802_08370 [Thermococcus guaymasensis DSM 11113]|uniref:Uncharacterized protein n=1 Tax=Thermococcus guaymasensis DSM 11113 TaxID=1432656 RepID=A0A0X1KNC5_9EURY|nr:hypothetical protein X802_08370 [Thermococcus guaymasensis DSM 11113]